MSTGNVDINNQQNGQYYNNMQSPLQRMFGGMNMNVGNNLPNFNNESMIKPNNTPYNYIDINALFPQLMQGAASNQSTAGLLGDSSTGATQSASSGAGRFI